MSKISVKTIGATNGAWKGALPPKKYKLPLKKTEKFTSLPKILYHQTIVWL